MATDWSNFYVAAVGAAAALIGLLFVAVSLRPREIRRDPLMAGRARSAFYAFLTVLFTAFLALAAAPAPLVGGMQVLVALAILGISAPFTLTAWRARQLNYRRAGVYHAGLVLVAVGGALRALTTSPGVVQALLAAGVMLLMGIAISNSWQLVISHGSEVEETIAEE